MSKPPLSASPFSSTALKAIKEADTSATASPVGDDEASSLAILELRRQRNRESMQRARQKQKDGIQSMRRTLETLSLQFEQLREQQKHSTNNAMIPSADVANQSASFAQLETAYGSLAETSHRLKAENFLVQRLLVEHEKTKLRLIEAIKNVNSWSVDTNMASIVAEKPAAQFFEYTDISPDQAQDSTSACYRRIVQYEQTARPLAHWIIDASGPSCTFEWTVNCEISTGNNFFLSMIKRLPGVTAQEAMERSWAVVSRERRSDKSPTRRLARSAVLQTLNDSTQSQSTVECMDVFSWHVFAECDDAQVPDAVQYEREPALEARERALLHVALGKRSDEESHATSSGLNLIFSQMHSTAEFLLESLLADALLLNGWGTRVDDLRSQHPVSPHAHLTQPNTTNVSSISTHPPSPSACSSLPVADGVDTRVTTPSPPEEDEASAAVILERRRQRSREAMQRTRQKQKDGIESMRETLEALSLQFERLREQQQRRLSYGDIRSTWLLNQETSFVQLESAFGSLAETSHRLKAEKFLLQRLLVEHEKTKLRLLDVVKSSSTTTSATDQQRIAAMGTPHQEPAAQFFEYKDISLGQVQDAISGCYQRILQFEQTARPLAHWIVEASGPCRTFGWTINCEISSGNNFFVSETKRLPGLTPLEAMQRTWVVMSRERKEDTSPSRRLARSAVLQVLNDSTCVVGDDIHHPVKAGVRMRMITVRFRMATERGYVVGLGSVNPQNPEIRSHAQPAVEFMDVFSWHEFTEDDNGGCLATIKSLTQYNTSENLRLRLVNGLCITWRWENEVMQRPMQFLAV